MDWHVPGTCKFLLFWLLRKARADLDPRLGPARRGPPRPRGSAFGLVAGEVLAARIISARTPEPYPRMKTGRVLDIRLVASNFYIAQLRFFGQPMVDWPPLSGPGGMLV